MTLELRGLSNIRDTGIVIPALPRPTLEELRAGDEEAKRLWIERIQSDNSPVVAVRLHIAGVVGPDEESIDSADYDGRLTEAEERGLLLGYQHARWLRANKSEFSSEAQAELDKIVPRRFIDCPGLVIIRNNGSIGVLTMAQKFDVHFMSTEYVFHRMVALGVPVE